MTMEAGQGGDKRIDNQRIQGISPELKDGIFQIKKAHQDPRTMDETHQHQGCWLGNFRMLRTKEVPKVSKDESFKRSFRKESE